MICNINTHTSMPDEQILFTLGIITSNTLVKLEAKFVSFFFLNLAE